EFADKMPDGYHKAIVVKVLRGPKDGPDFTSKNGDAQVMAVFVNAAGEEASTMFTLSDKAARVLAKFLESSGANLAKMNDAGVTLRDFENQTFAQKQLMDRECWIEVEWKQGDKKDYSKIAFVKESDLPVHVLAKTPVGAGTGDQHHALDVSD